MDLLAKAGEGENILLSESLLVPGVQMYQLPPVVHAAVEGVFSFAEGMPVNVEKHTGEGTTG